jgi:hypothetical protein
VTNGAATGSVTAQLNRHMAAPPARREIPDYRRRPRPKSGATCRHDGAPRYRSAVFTDGEESGGVLTKSGADPGSGPVPGIRTACRPGGIIGPALAAGALPRAPLSSTAARPARGH